MLKIFDKNKGNRYYLTNMPAGKLTVVADEDPNALAKDNSELKSKVDALENNLNPKSGETVSSAEFQALQAQLADIQNRLNNTLEAKTGRAIEGTLKGAGNLAKMSFQKIGAGWSHLTDFKNSEIIRGTKAVDQAVTAFGDDVTRDVKRAVSDAKESRANAIQRQIDMGYSATGTLGGDIKADWKQTTKDVQAVTGAVGGVLAGTGALLGSAVIKGAHMAGGVAQVVGGAASNAYQSADAYVVNKSNEVGAAIKGGIQAVDQAVTAFGQGLDEDIATSRQDLRDAVNNKANEKNQAANMAGLRVGIRNDVDQALENSKSQVKDNVINQKAMNKPLNVQMKQIIYQKLAGNEQFSGENKPQFNTLSELQTILASDGFTTQEAEAMNELINTVIASQDLTVVDNLGIKAGEASIGLAQVKNNLGKTGDQIQQKANQVGANMTGYLNTDVRQVGQDIKNVMNTDVGAALKGLFNRGKIKKEDN